MANPAAALQQLIQDLGNHLANQNNLLTQQVQTLQQQNQPVLRLAETIYALPGKFKGERGPDAQRFLIEIKRFIDRQVLSLDTINKQVECALSYMEDKAANWKQRYLQALDNGGTPFANWDEFKDAFKLAFERIEDSTEALEELKRLYQGKKSTAEYHALFDRAAARTTLSDFDKRTRFYDGLSKVVKDALIFTNKNVDDYGDLVKEAIRLDNHISQRKWEEGRDNRSPRLWSAPAGNITTSSTRDPNAMDVDAGKTPDTRTCYNCGKQGHIRRFCRERPKLAQGQNIRATGTEPTAAGNEGEVVAALLASISNMNERMIKLESFLKKDKEDF